MKKSSKIAPNTVFFIQDMANYSCIAENIAGRRESDVAVLSVYGMFTMFTVFIL